MEGVIDFAREADRPQKEIDKLGGELRTVSKKLRNEDFLSKAPADVVEKVREKHGSYRKAAKAAIESGTNTETEFIRMPFAADCKHIKPLGILKNNERS
jgi:valyl-tRNA synthetase